MIVLAVLFCAICAFAIVWIWEGYVISSYPPEHDPPTTYSKTPAIYYVGTHAFKVPQDYSFLSVSDYGGPGNTQLIFDFYYPDFSALLDNPNFVVGEGTSRDDNRDVEIYLIAQDNTSTGLRELQAIKAGTNTDKIKPGPYGLLEIHQRDDSTWVITRHYIGLFNKTAIDITCDNPDIIANGSRNDSCLGFYPYEDLNIEESFSVPNLQHWRRIVQKTIHFLAIHEVK